MSNRSVIAIDLAKSVFEICVLNSTGKVTSKKTLSRKALSSYLSKQKPSLVAMETCTGAHYWARIAQSFGHEVMLIPAHAVKPFRRGHKTDANDALAIAVAARQPNIKPVAAKTVEQQNLQSVQRMYDHAVDQRTAVSNMIRGLLAEFGLVFPKGFAALKRNIPALLENPESGLPAAVCVSLRASWQHWIDLEHLARQHQKNLNALVSANASCHSLLDLEGVGPINALGLYVAIGNGSGFKHCRNASACIGLTPKQHSSGGKVKIGTIGRYCGMQKLRSSLIQGARSFINALLRRKPATLKEKWLVTLIARRGEGRAAVALANKNVRTAYAMLKHHTQYQAIPLS